MLLPPPRVSPKDIPYPFDPTLLCKDTFNNLSVTIFRKKEIACFVIGGELRLCLPQVDSQLSLFIS